MSEPGHLPLERVRRYTWWTLVLSAGAAAVGMALEALRAKPTGAVLVLAASAVVLVEYVRVTASVMPGVTTAVVRRWESPLGLVLGFAVWWYGLAQGMSVMIALFPAAAVAAASAGKRGRWVMSVAGCLFIAVSGLPFQTDVRGSVGAIILVTTLISMVYAVTNHVQVWLWALVRELDDARGATAELAVARERLRFAADLHDIQGHHLQAIALKGELAERLVGRDDDAARAQLAEVAELARQALRETRDVVRGYRRADLTTEIGNAVAILRAAGIDATVDGDTDAVPPPLRPVFGALVREGTTNILRHSKASRCTLGIRVTGGVARVELDNDNPHPPRTTDGTGLNGLRERFATVNGAVRVTTTDDRFHLIGEVTL